MPSWERMVSVLRDSGESPIIRMIDGLPAFPDEIPTESWKELRLGLTGGMVTVRRSAVEMTCVCWGTDDEGLKQSFENVVQACQFAVK